MLLRRTKAEGSGRRHDRSHIDHGIMIELLEKKIDDWKFLRVIKKMLEAGYMEDWKFHRTYTGTPQGGIITPPTKLQTFFFGVRIASVRIDPKHDIDLVPRYFHPLHQRTDQVPFTGPVSVLQAIVDFGGELL